MKSRNCAFLMVKNEYCIGKDTPSFFFLKEKKINVLKMRFVRPYLSYIIVKMRL